MLHESAFRLPIAAEYDRVHKQPPPDEWFGADGTIAAIVKGITWLSVMLSQPGSSVLPSLHSVRGGVIIITNK